MIVRCLGWLKPRHKPKILREVPGPAGKVSDGMCGKCLEGMSIQADKLIKEARWV